MRFSWAGHVPWRGIVNTGGLRCSDAIGRTVYISTTPWLCAVQSNTRALNNEVARYLPSLPLVSVNAKPEKRHGNNIDIVL